MFEKILNGSKLFAGLFKIVRELVEAVEVPGEGEKKKKAVLDIVEAIWNLADDQTPGIPLPQWETVEPVFEKAVDLIVELKNAVNNWTNGGE